jgi:hypothetical protein
MQGRWFSARPNLKPPIWRSRGSNFQHLDRIENDCHADGTFGLADDDRRERLIHWYGQTPPAKGASMSYACSSGTWIANYERRLNHFKRRERFPGGCLIAVGDIYDPPMASAIPKACGLPGLIAESRAYNQVHRAAENRIGHTPVVRRFRHGSLPA